jgi:hypothetical protein
MANPEEREMSEATTLQPIQGGFTRLAARMVLPVVAVALGSGGSVPTAPMCPTGQVPVVSSATYAIYTTSASQSRLEDVTKLKNRCFVPVTQMPSGSGSTSQPSSCATGTSPLGTGTVWGTYYDGKDVGRQAEDTSTVNDRCVVEIPQAITSPCPPGTHARVVGGKTYCVPN